MSTIMFLALITVAGVSPNPRTTAHPARCTPASLEATCAAQLDREAALDPTDSSIAVERAVRDLLPADTAGATFSASTLDPLLCAAIIAAKSAACCAVCKEEYPNEYIKSCGWNVGCVRGECTCEHYPL